ncbi:hypothetical protein D3C71_1271390 [compost metagenome]
MQHAVGHRVHHIACTEHAQAAHPDRTGGGAIAVEIANDQDAFVVGDRIGQQRYRGLHAAQQIRRVQLGQLRLCLRGIGDPARGVQALQQRQHGGRPLADGGGRTALDTGCFRLGQNGLDR